MGNGDHKYTAMDNIHHNDTPVGADSSEHCPCDSEHSQLPQTGKYTLGKSFFSEIPQETKPAVIDYKIPGEVENQMRLHALTIRYRNGRRVIISTKDDDDATDTIL